MSFINLIVRFTINGRSHPFRIEKNVTVEDMCHQIRTMFVEAQEINNTVHGIYVPDPDPKHSFWLEESRLLSYYHLSDNSEVEYRCKLRFLTVQTMDGTRKKLQVDDSRTVAELMDTICDKMGITNHDEYSLVRPMDEEEKMRTLTLRKAKSMAKDHEKLERMKQKLHTDDELNWLAHGRTLRQQGVEVTDVLILRRKYFFSDQNVDARDPVQLNLLYMQSKEAILNGTHPISMEQAIKLAALQCQSEMGILTPEKAKNNPIDLKEHLPIEYCKVKGVDKRIQETHKKLGAFDERDSKLRYVQLCRSLPTYGITFFLIKEKLKGRNKLVPRLFGVSKESAMRVDEKTKEILETWPLTRIRRWAVGVNLFTLDFGQYKPDGNYAMQTTEGEQIGQILSGYIDIILRRQRSKQSCPMDEDDGNTIVEENVAPSKANVIASTLPRGHRAESIHLAHSGTLRSTTGRGDYSEGHLATRGQTVTVHHLGSPQAGSGQIVNRNGLSSTSLYNGGDRRPSLQVIDLGQPKRALLTRIGLGLRTIKEAADELDSPIYPNDDALRGDDATSKHWRREALEQARSGVWGHLSAMTMATNRLVSYIEPISPGKDNQGDGVAHHYDYTNMDASVASIGMNVRDLMQCVRLFDQIDSADAEPSGRHAMGMSLKEAAQNLSDAFIDLMRATVPVDVDVDLESDQVSLTRSSSTSLSDQTRRGPDRLALLEAAGRVGDASQKVLQLISQPGVPSMEARVESTGTKPAMAPPPPPPTVDWEARDRLLSTTKSVASQMAALVKTAKMGAMNVGQEATELSQLPPHTVHPQAIPMLRATQARLVHAATTAGKLASCLVTCAKVAACTLEQPESQNQLIQTAKLVGQAANGVTETVEDLVAVSPEIAAGNDQTHEMHLQLSDDLHEGVAAVHARLDSLVESLQSSSMQSHQDPIVSTVLSMSTQIPASVGDGMELVRKAAQLASAASHLVEELRAEAVSEHPRIGIPAAEATRRADVLEAGVHRLLLTAQNCINGNAQSLEHQQLVVVAAQELVAAVHATNAPVIRARLTQSLEFATRMTASNAGPLATVGGEVVRLYPENTHKLAANLDQLRKHIMPQVNQSCLNARTEPYNAQKQTNLLLASQNLMQCLEELLRSTDAVIPTIPDAGVQIAFSGAAQSTQACLNDLRLCYTDSKPILSTEAPTELQPMPVGMEQTLPSANSDTLWQDFAAKAKQCLEALRSELRSTSTRLLPNQTLDSVCVGLWAAVGRFNRSFHSTSSSRDSSFAMPGLMSNEPTVPLILTRLMGEEQQLPSQNSLHPPRDWTRTTAVVDELIDRLSPLIQGVRALTTILRASAGETTLDSQWARVLLVSHGLATRRHSTQSGGSNPPEPVTPLSLASNFTQPEDQPQATADAMLQHLLSIGESCLDDASQFISAIVQPHPVDTVNGHGGPESQQVALVADQLITSVNAVPSYLPGEVIVRRLFALLEDVARMQQIVDSAGRAPINPPSSPNSAPSLPPRHAFTRVSSIDVHSKLSEAARRLAKVCFDTSCQLSDSNTISADSQAPTPTVRLRAVGGGSKLVRMAHTADRLTSTLAEVVRAAGGRGGELAGHWLDDLPRIGLPVALGLRHAMRTIDLGPNQDYDLAVPEISPQQAVLRLRDWAVELSLQADSISPGTDQTTTASNGAPKSPPSLGSMKPSSPTAPSNGHDVNETLIETMRNQCQASTRRLQAMLPHTMSASADPESPSRQLSSTAAATGIRVPVNNQTYAECMDEVIQTSEEMKPHLDQIPTAANQCNAEAFNAAVKAVAQATCQLLQATNQTAYLVGAGHPASKPGSTDRYACGSDQLIALHDHIAAVRKGTSELGRADSTLTPDGIPSLEVMNIATNVAQRATQLCQSTRPMLSDCKNVTEKRAMAESLERVARAAAALFKSTQSARQSSSSADTGQVLKSGALQLEEAVDQYADILFRSIGGSPAQMAEDAFTLQTPLLNSGQAVVQSSSDLLNASQDLITTDANAFATASNQFTQHRSALDASIESLTSQMQQLLPGLSSCDSVLAINTKLQTELDNTSMAIASGRLQCGPNVVGSQRLETALGLIRASLTQIDQHQIEAVNQLDRAHLELVSHEIHDIGVYLPNLVKQCVQTAMGLSQPSERNELLSLIRTVLEAIHQMVDSVKARIQAVSPTKSASKIASLQQAVSQSTHQLQQACAELLSRVDGIAKIQGGLSWHITSIREACAKLDDLPSSSELSHTDVSLSKTTTSFSLPESFVEHHTRLGHQSRALSGAAARLADWSINTNHPNPADSLNRLDSVAQGFVQMATTVHAIASILARQTHQYHDGRMLAQRLCQLTQAVGAACSDFLRAPSQVEAHTALTNRLEDLKATVQVCARGADACATAASKIGRLVADLDTAALFACAGVVDPVSPGSSTTKFNEAQLATRLGAFDSAKDHGLRAIGDLEQEIRNMLKTTDRDQDALAISAQNCVNRADELTGSIKTMTTWASSLPPASKVTPASCMEAKVQLLTLTRDVCSSLVRFLAQGKSVAATSYALNTWGDQQQAPPSVDTVNLITLVSSHQTAWSEIASTLFDQLNDVTGASQTLSNLLHSSKSTDTDSPPIPSPTENHAPVSPPSIPPKRVSFVRNAAVTPAQRTSTSSTVSGGQEENLEKNQVRSGLASVLTAFQRLDKRLQTWSVEEGTLKRPAGDCDLETEAQNAMGQVTLPDRLVAATVELKDALIKTKNATNSGRLSEMSMAGHLLRRATEDLVRTLPATCDSALMSMRNRKRSAVNGNGHHGSEYEEEDEEFSPLSVEKACKRAITGACSTLSELEQLLKHMIESLDTGSSSPASTQVTLATRRLRETVHEIVEGAKGMPGGDEAVHARSADSRPTISPKPFAVVMNTGPSSPPPAIRPQRRRVERTASLMTSAKHQDAVEKSIAAANATASDTTAVPLQKEFEDMAGELERHVYQIGQLHSRRTRVRASVRRSMTAAQEETDPNAVPSPKLSPTDASVPAETSTEEGLDGVIAACQHVVHTTLSLMYWAAAAQRELVQQGRVEPMQAADTSESESQWAQGLISAARYVGAAANYVVDSARTMVAKRCSTLIEPTSTATDLGLDRGTGAGSRPEQLISAAHTTASCTAQLVLACMAKADPSSQSCIGLRRAGMEVKQATDQLVRLAQGYAGCETAEITDESGSSFDGLNSSVVSSMRQVIETKSNIAAKQRELETLHSQLKHINRDQYKSHAV